MNLKSLAKATLLATGVCASAGASAAILSFNAIDNTGYYQNTVDTNGDPIVPVNGMTATALTSTLAWGNGDSMSMLELSVLKNVDIDTLNTPTLLTTIKHSNFVIPTSVAPLDSGQIFVGYELSSMGLFGGGNYKVPGSPSLEAVYGAVLADPDTPNMLNADPTASVLTLFDFIFDETLNDQPDDVCPYGDPEPCDDAFTSVLAGGLALPLGIKLYIDSEVYMLTVSNTVNGEPIDPGMGQMFFTEEGQMNTLETWATLMYIPTPGTLAVLGLGLLGLSNLRRKSSN